MPLFHRLDTTVTLVCAACGVNFHPRRDLVSTPLTCSKACLTVWRRRNMAEKPCARCGKSFVPKQAGQRYCSLKCARKKRDIPARECLWCRTTFIPKRPEAKYCSLLCARGASLSQVPRSVSNSPETNAKRRATQLARIAAGVWVPPNIARVPGHETTESAPRSREDIGEPEGSAPREPLSYPPIGREARTAWRLNGELRQAQVDALLSRQAIGAEGRTVILAGQGSYMGVEGGALVVHQGRTHGVPAPSKERLYPAVHNVRRILWVGEHGHMTGTMTLAAASWCAREGIHLVALDGSDFPLLELAPMSAPQDVALRRRQWLISSGAVLAGCPTAEEVARDLVRRKVEGQQRALIAHEELPGRDHALIALGRRLDYLRHEAAPELHHSLDYLRALEMRTALAYFRAWEGLRLRWAKPDTKRVPEYWLAARGRVSPLSPSDNARHAVDPLNACLNYAYGCLITQCRRALLAEGLDLTCGFLHADKPRRDSLTYDLAELERGAVDDLLLTFLGKTTLHYADFAREESGHVMVHPQFTRLLIANVRVPQERVNEHAKWLRLRLSGDN